MLLICTARNERQAKAIHDEVHVRLKHEDDLLPRRVEGLPEARWVLLDYLDCILHVFVPETRDLYRLDQLWGEGARIDLGLATDRPPARSARADPPLECRHPARHAVFPVRDRP